VADFGRSAQAQLRVITGEETGWPAGCGSSGRRIRGGQVRLSQPVPGGLAVAIHVLRLLPVFGPRWGQLARVGT